MLMPQACSATNSRSADSRPNAIRRPSSSAIGIVTASACGSSVSSTRATSGHDDALGDQLLAVLGERRDHQEEGEDQQPEQEGQQEFADDIAVEDPEHLGAAGA